MTFASKSQRRKFYALKAEGKMDQKTIDEWEKDTPEDLPEKVGSRRMRTVLNVFIDAQNQILQEDPEYKKIRKKLMKKEAFWRGFEKRADVMEDFWFYLDKVDPELAERQEDGLKVKDKDSINRHFKKFIKMEDTAYTEKQQRNWNKDKDMSAKRSLLGSLGKGALGAGLGAAFGGSLAYLGSSPLRIFKNTTPVANALTGLGALGGGGIIGKVFYEQHRENPYYGMTEKQLKEHIKKTLPSNTSGKRFV